MDVESAMYNSWGGRTLRAAPFGFFNILLCASPQLRNRSLCMCQFEAVLAVEGLWHARQTLGVMSLPQSAIERKLCEHPVLTLSGRRL
jgi:hypothetical protein